MEKSKFLNIFLLALTGIFFVLGNKLGTISYFISSVSIIVWAIFCLPKKKRPTL